MNLSSLDVVCATDYEEFFYKENDEPVCEGTPVGFDVDKEEGVELVLFTDIYWNPQYEDYED